MNTCSCGNLIYDQGPRCTRCAALQSLGLGAEAPESEIRNAYRLLVKVWHPDHFQDDPKLKESAEAKLKEVESAFELLTSTSTERGQWRPADFAALAAAPPMPPEEVPAPKTTSDVGLEPIGFLQKRPGLRIWPGFKYLGLAVLAVLIFIVVKDARIAFRAPYASGPVTASDLASGKVNLLSGPEAAKQRFLDAVEQDLHRLDPRRPAPAPQPQIDQPTPETAVGQPIEKAHPAAKPAPPAPIKLKPYITAGSTREEVLAQQGPPSSSTQDKLVYGKSELYLKDDAVVGWRIDPSNPLRVKLWPQTRVDPDTQSFTTGSSKDEVLVVQGTPTAFSEDQFEYGKSIVYFQNNRVIHWKSASGSVTLFAR